LPGEDSAACEALLADLSELRFVREMADADWRLSPLSRTPPPGMLLAFG
jgi:hypothetical protein